MFESSNLQMFKTYICRFASCEGARNDDAVDQEGNDANENQSDKGNKDQEKTEDKGKEQKQGKN